MPWLRSVYLALHPLNLVALAGWWCWRQWGVWLTVGLAPVALLIEIAIGMPLTHNVRVPVVLTVLLVLRRKYGHRFV